MRRSSCDRAMVVVAGNSIALGVGSSREHEPREMVAMDAAEARELARALLAAVRQVRRR